MDREATIGHIIAKELPADLVRLMKEQGSSPDKIERAASTLSNRKKRRAAGSLTNLFEVSAASSAPTALTEQKPPPSLVSTTSKRLPRYSVFDSQSAAGGTDVSKWRTALNPVRAIQGMRRPSIAQPFLTQTEAAVAKPEPDVTPDKGFKWKTVFHAVKAADDIKSHAGVGGGSRSEVGGSAGDSGDSPSIGGDRSSPLDSRYSVYLLYQYTSTNIDTPLLA
jgi:hypothetical protein